MDASDLPCAAVVAQVLSLDLSLVFADQSHKPLASLSMNFHDTEQGWSTLEEKVYALMASKECMH